MTQPALALNLVSHAGTLPLRLGATRKAILAEMAALGHAPSSQDDQNAVLRAALIATLGEEGAQEFLPKEAPESGNTLYFIDNAIEITFGADDLANFIGISQHPHIALCFEGVDLMQAPARAVFDILAQHEDAPPAFAAEEVLFQKQIVTLWNADPQYSRHDPAMAVWEQIGVGNADYLARVARSR